MNDKNKYTIKIILVILLGIALLATLISCCVVATKENTKSKAKAINAPLQSNEVLSDSATASSVDNDYISILQANTDDVYYAIKFTTDTNYFDLIYSCGSQKKLFDIKTNDNINYVGVTYVTGNLCCVNISFMFDKSTSKIIHSFGYNGFTPSNEYICNIGFKFENISAELLNFDVYVRTTPYTSGGDIAELQAQIATLTAEKSALQTQIDDLTAEKTALQAQIAEKQNQIDALTAEKATLQSQVNDLTADKTALQAQVEQLQYNIGILNDEKADLQAIIEQKDNVQSKLYSMLNDKEIQIKDLQAQIATLTAEKETLQRENNVLREQIENTSFCMKFYYCYTDDSGTLHGSKPQTLTGNNHSGYFDTKKLYGYIPSGMKPFYDFTEGMLRIYPSQDGSLSTTDTPVYFKGFADFVYRSKLQYEKDNYVTKYVFSNDDKTNYIVFWVENYGLDWQNDAILKDNAYHIGYQNGLNDAEQSGYIFESSTSFIKSTFTDLGKLLDIKIFGNITIGTIIGIPLVLIVVMAVLKLVRG